MTRKINIEAGSLLTKKQDKSAFKNVSLMNNDTANNKNGFTNYLNGKTSSLPTKNNFDPNLKQNNLHSNLSKKPSEKVERTDKDISVKDFPKNFHKGNVDDKRLSDEMKIFVQQNSNLVTLSNKKNHSGTDGSNFTTEHRDTEGILNEDSIFELAIVDDRVQVQEIALSSLISRTDRDTISDSMIEEEDSLDVDVSFVDSRVDLPNLWSMQTEHREDSISGVDSAASSFIDDSLGGYVVEIADNNDSTGSMVVGEDAKIYNSEFEDSAAGIDDEDSAAGIDDEYNSPEIGIAQSFAEFAQRGVELKSDIDFKNADLQSVNDNQHEQISITDKELQEKLLLGLLNNKTLNAKNKSGDNPSLSTLKIITDTQGKASKPMDSVVSSSANLFFADDGESDVAARFFAGLEEVRGLKSEISGLAVETESDSALNAGKISEISDADAGNSSGDKLLNSKSSAQQINNFGGKIENEFGDKKVTISFKENLGNSEGAPKELHQVSMSVKHAIASNRSEIKINMHPKALGAVDVTLELIRGEAGEQIITNIKISAENKHTLEILEKSQIELQKILSEVKESKDASLEFNMKKQDDEQGKLLYSNSEEREAWMNQFEVNEDGSNDEKSISSVLQDNKSKNDSDLHLNKLIPGKLNIKV